MVYTSAALSLAALETLVHLDVDIEPIDYVAIRIEVPDDLRITTIEVAKLPHGWRAYPAPIELQAIGEAWLEAGETAVLQAPSVVVPDEWNYLINPLHKDAKRISTVEVKPFRFDPRLF